uniref:Uncharacterized protein n=1 Tax=Rhizophora mucronata TaxID=61149 RepID=A0A2P2QFU9_RHIMU
MTCMVQSLFISYLCDYYVSNCLNSLVFNKLTSFVCRCITWIHLCPPQIPHEVH